MPKEKALRASQRFSNTTPEGLRIRVMSAIPQWERIARKQRQALAMLPVYGTWEDACEATGAEVKTSAQFGAIVSKWSSTGLYPEHTRTKTARKRGETRETFEIKAPLTQSELLQQLANEMAALALIKAEGSLTAASALKLAEQSGWFLNIEAEVEKARAYTDHRIGKQMASLDKPTATKEPETGVPEFEQDQDVDDNFTGETAAAKAQNEPTESTSTNEYDSAESPIV